MGTVAGAGRGGNHLAKILAKKCSGKLNEITERLRRPVFEEEKVEELYGEILMAGKAQRKMEKDMNIRQSAMWLDWMGKYKEIGNGCCTWPGIRNPKKSCLNRKDKSKRKLPTIT